MRRPIDRAAARLGRLLDRLADALFATPLLVLLGIGLAHGALTHGIWDYVVSSELLELSRNLGEPVLLDKPQEQWVMSSTLGPALAALVGMNGSAGTFLVLHLAVFVVVSTAGFLLLRCRVGDRPTKVFLVAVFLTPFYNVMMTWLGSPDPFTLAFVFALVLGWRNPAVVAVAGALMGVNHAEQGVVIVTLTALYLGMAHGAPERWAIARFVAACGIAIVLSRVGLETFYHLADIGPQMSRTELRQQTGTWSYVRSALSNPWTALFSTYGLFWPVLVLLWTAAPDRRLAWAFLVSSGLGLAITCMATLDIGRVAMLVGFVPLAFFLTSRQFVELGAWEHPLVRRLIAAGAFAGLLAPRIVVWDGKVHASVTWYTVQRAWALVTGAEPPVLDPFHGLF